MDQKKKNNTEKCILQYAWQHITKYHYEIVAVVAILSLVLNISLTTWSILVNRTSTDLNIRPYVSVDMPNPGKFGSFYGNNIILQNKGKIPASNVLTKYYITTDTDKKNMNGLKWFKENLGGFGSISYIVPDAIEVEPGLRDLSISAEYYYFEALSSYEGLNSNRKYWTHIKKLFYIDKEAKALKAVYIYGEWDRNSNFTVPILSTEDKVIKLIEDIKKEKNINKK